MAVVKHAHGHALLQFCGGVSYVQTNTKSNTKNNKRWKRRCTLPFPLTFKCISSSPFPPSPRSRAFFRQQQQQIHEDDDDDDFAAFDYEDDEQRDTSNSDVEMDGDDYGVAEDGKERQEMIEEFCQRFEHHNSDITVQDLSSLYPFALDKFQRLAIKYFLEGSSVVVCAPTSSGKTVIADAAAAVTIAKKKRLFYSTPLKALSNQKFREFREAFGEKNVGLVTGDATINHEARVVILTAEILRNMLYQSIGAVSEGSRLGQVDVIVLDEVHYLSDISRGTVWEEIVIYCPKEVQLICLSATIANPEELSGWIQKVHGPTKLVTSNWRPVPLTWHVSRKTGLLPLLNRRSTKMNKKLTISRYTRENDDDFLYENALAKTRKAKKKFSHKNSNHESDEFSKEEIQHIRRLQVPRLKDSVVQLIVKNMLPAIWFIFSRKGCDQAAQYLNDLDLLNENEHLKVCLAVDKFKTVYPDAVRKDAVRYLLKGIAVHHAGCLPLWKSFIEDLFQQGLLKVVFATETLAAGINMPARTTVISSLSKRGNDGHELLSSNALFQMAGRAGRRGIDTEGHVVIVQTPFEGPEECCKLLFAGSDPLVSQFSASYGMVLNILGARKVIYNDKHGNGTKMVYVRRTLDEARALIEKSFGNYLSSEVVMRAKEQLEQLQLEICKLEEEVSDERLSDSLKETLTEEECMEALDLVGKIEELETEEKKLFLKLQQTKVNVFKPLLNISSEEAFRLICLHYNDDEARENYVPALCIGKVEDSSYKELEIEEMLKYPLKIATEDTKHFIKSTSMSPELNVMEGQFMPPSYYAALGADNSWYLFTERWVERVYQSDSSKVPSMVVDTSAQVLISGFEEVTGSWEKLGHSEFGTLWFTEGSLETWSWSLKIPLRHTLEENEVELPEEYTELVKRYKAQSSIVSEMKSDLRKSKWYTELTRLSEENNIKKEKLKRLRTKSNRITKRISKIEPTGWKEFLLVGNVLQEMGALDIDTGHLYPLGETASRIRGVNELWLAFALRCKTMVGLKPAELAAVCGSLVSEGIKIRPDKGNSDFYEASEAVKTAIENLEGKRELILQVQNKYKIDVSCDLDMQLTGLVEAWASGLTWTEIMMDCPIDDGDFARLLRRTIDLLAQIPELPGIDASVKKTAMLAAEIMDRSPISELVA